MTSTARKNWPDIILPTPVTEKPFRSIFGGVARVDLREYDAVVTNGGERVWRLFVNECQMQGIEFSS
jgi:hypothetical protein